MSQNPTLSAAAKKLAKATGAKHTVCLRALEQAATATTDPTGRLELATRLMAAGTTSGDIAHLAVPDAPAFTFETWWGSGRHLGIYGEAKSGKTVFAQYLAAEALFRGVRSWLISPHRWDHASWSGLVEPSPTSPRDPWAQTLLDAIADDDEDRILFVEELGALAGDPVDPDADARLRAHGLLLRRLIENAPPGLRIITVAQRPARSSGEAMTAMLQGGDHIVLGAASTRALASAGARPGTVNPSNRGHGVWISPVGQGAVEPVTPRSFFATSRDWNLLYRPEGYRAIEDSVEAPVQIQAGDRLRYWCEKRLVWTARAVANEGDIVVATTTIFGQPSYLATSFARGIRGPHDSWGHAAVTDEDCVSTAAALASGEIDFSARNSVRLDLRSVERDGKIIWSDEE